MQVQVRPLLDDIMACVVVMIKGGAFQNVKEVLGNILLANPWLTIDLTVANQCLIALFLFI